MCNELLSHITDYTHTHTHTHTRGVKPTCVCVRECVSVLACGDDGMIHRLIAAVEAGGISSGSE